ncbi:MAG: hypothetical protein LAP61_27635 [Acidobacteriia bacterium]|nr:hypothetical protein [Terriglobia bacterium]
MSRNAMILEKETPDKLPQGSRRRAEFRGLIHRLFHDHSAAALIGPGAGSRTREACWGLAKELAADRRVVIVDVDRMLRVNPLPPTTTCLADRVSNIWHWPPVADGSAESPHEVPASVEESDWYSNLRRAFDAVLLNCPALETEPAAAEIAARADSAVLVVEAGKTKKKQIRQDERTLARRGVKLAGCILMKKR